MTPEEEDALTDALMVAVSDLINPLMDGISLICDTAVALWDVLQDHPEWVRLYQSAKRPRTRKKYANKIWREYQRREKNNV